MPRPSKYKKVCKMPKHNTFFSSNNNKNLETIEMTVEEYEVLRLIDKENFTQEECSKWMNVSRQTIQIIYTNARKKIADFLIDGNPLKIIGGNYEICDKHTNECNCKNCKCHTK